MMKTVRGCQGGQRNLGKRPLLLWVGILGCALPLGGCEDDDPLGPSSPTHLEFVIQPTSVGVGSPVSPSITVAARDKNGKAVWSWTEPVTLNLEAGTGGGALGGTATVTPVGGTAIFNDLLFEEPVEGVQVVAQSGRLEPAVSQVFQVYGVFRSRSVSGGGYHTCAVAEDGSAHCWGKNGFGQLGDGTLTDHPLPTPVATGEEFTSLTSGGYHTCGLTGEGFAYCWGYNAYSQLGASTPVDCGPEYPCSASPVKVSGGAQWIQLSAGAWHTCGLTAAGEMYCWGLNGRGELGDGTGEDRAVPTLVSGGHHFVQISAGYQHSCGLTAEGLALCWGGNVYGEIGDSTHTMRTEPTPVYGNDRFRAIIAGGSNCHGHTCGITTDGAVYCWGRTYQGYYPQWQTAPVPLLGDPGLESVVVGGSGACGLRGDGALYCWGEGGYGQVGHGSTQNAYEPVAVGPNLQFGSVSFGRYHTCGVTVDGTTYCWGRNWDGQLGNSSNADGWTVPVSVWGF